MGERKPRQGVVQEFKKCTGSTAKAKGRIHESRPGEKPKEAASHLPAVPSQHMMWGFQVGTTQPTLLSSLLGGAFSSIPVTWNNLNVSFWTETGSNYAKKLEDSQDSKALTFIPTTKMYLCSHRRAFASCSGHRALPNWAKGLCLRATRHQSEILGYHRQGGQPPSQEISRDGPTPHTHLVTPKKENRWSKKALAWQFSSSSLHLDSGSRQVLQLSPKIKVKWNKSYLDQCSVCKNA